MIENQVPADAARAFVGKYRQEAKPAAESRFVSKCANFNAIPINLRSHHEHHGKHHASSA